LVGVLVGVGVGVGVGVFVGALVGVIVGVFVGGGGTRSYAPMSTMGGVPDPVSATAGSSKKRGRPAISDVMPPGTAALFPESMADDPEPSRKSFPAGFTKSGFALMLPGPENPEPPMSL
jgi:hypothetical protein